MGTECKPEQLEFEGLGRRSVVADFEGGTITSDAGALLLRELELSEGIVRRFAECFDDYRDGARIEHTVEQLLAQRIYALALGYEDVNDHETLRSDPLMATLAQRPDPTGSDRRRKRDRGCAGAGKSTLNRLELGPTFGVEASKRTKKIVARPEKIDAFFVEAAMHSAREAPAEVILDLDPTDVELFGHQEGRFFHGYYDSYCYLPLLVFWEDRLLCARLRRSNVDGAQGAPEELARIVAQMRKRWPRTRFIVRGDSGFAREPLMAWCEASGVDYLFGLARNNRLVKAIEAQLGEAAAEHKRTGKAARVFAELEYRTQSSWGRARRVVAKAEHLDKGSNPRFVVTSLTAGEIEARKLYEEMYCARGDMENRIKEHQSDLFGDRLSCETMQGNQMRLWLASVAYVLMAELRRRALKDTELERATCATIRGKLLKVGAQVVVSVRRVVMHLSSAWPWSSLMRHALARLRETRQPPSPAPT